MEAKFILGSSHDRRSEKLVGGSSRTRPATKQVLIVEDHDLFRAVLGIVLQQHANFGDSIEAGSLAEARRALEVARGKVDLAIVDLDLHNSEAFELIEELRETDVPVVALTTNRDVISNASDMQPLDVGASEVLITTVPIKEIIAAALRLTQG